MGLSSEVIGEQDKDRGFDPRYMRKRLSRLIKVKPSPGKGNGQINPE
jgi:hypothetical protein